MDNEGFIKARSLRLNIVTSIIAWDCTLPKSKVKKSALGRKTRLFDLFIMIITVCINCAGQLIASVFFKRGG
jgi:hypothetical protein